MILVSALSMNSCSKDHTCDDGKQNQGERGIDCGGPCPACVSIPPTCTDGEQNQGETGIDCGGPCPPCGVTTTPTCTDGILNGSETGVDCGGPDCPACETPTEDASFTAVINGENWTAPSALAQVSGSILRIEGTNISTDRSVVLAHEGDFAVGTYQLAAGSTVFNDDLFGSNTVICQLVDSANGTIEFTEFNTVDQIVSGTFSFTCTDSNGVLTEDGTIVGEFSNVSY